MASAPKTVLGSRPDETVSVAGKLGKIKEQREDHTCVLRRGNYKNSDSSPENCLGFLSW
jgi:hypothetical protein